MLKLLSVQKSTRKDKKYMALFSDGKVVHFGARGYEDFTMHKDPVRRERYLSRHSRENWEDPQTPGSLSRYILWENPNLQTSIREYKRRFNL